MAPDSSGTSQSVVTGRFGAGCKHLGLGLRILFCCSGYDDSKPETQTGAAPKALTGRVSTSGGPKGTKKELVLKRLKKLQWARAFIDSDPRRQILEYFLPGDHNGPRGLLRVKELPLPKMPTTTYFSVWRPTSMDAVRMLMAGDATGKSLNIKGKSAKQGIISGFVPFLQIHEEKDKAKVRGTLRHCMVHSCCWIRLQPAADGDACLRMATHGGRQHSIAPTDAASAWHPH